MTTYTGVDLAMGSLPSVDNDHLRPAAEQQSDDLGVQPLVAVAALLVVGAALGAIGARREPNRLHPGGP